MRASLRVIHLAATLSFLISDYLQTSKERDQREIKERDQRDTCVPPRRKPYRDAQPLH